MAFAHLHNHGENSSLDGLSKISTIAKTAAALGQTAMALTDHGSLSGAWRFTKACKAAGIKPIIGIEIYMSIGSRFEKNFTWVDRNDDADADTENTKTAQKKKIYEHLTLLARNEAGWKSLLALHNKAEDSYWMKPRIDFDLLKEHGEGLIILSGCLGGPVAGPLSRAAAAEKAATEATAAGMKATEAGDDDAAVLLAATAQDCLAKAAEFDAEARTGLNHMIEAVGKDNVFLEIMYHGIEAERDVLNRIRALSKETGIPLVATNDCHYEHADDTTAHEGFLAVGSGKTLDDPARFKFNGSGYYIKSEEEMLAVVPRGWWAEACAQTQIIADMCEEQVIPTPHQRLPKFPVPAEFADSDAYLKHLSKEGAVERYGYDKESKARIPLSTEVKERLKVELDIIAEMGFPDYFLIVWDLINWCRSDAPIEFDNPDAPRKKPILVGPGRGSAAGSAVSYCLQIVGIDPLENNLLFERFLEPGRAGMPDIDVDFEMLRRPEVFAYAGYRWGKGNVARIGTFGVALSKAAIQDAARILKPSTPPQEIKDAAEALFKSGNRGEGAALLKDANKAVDERASHMLRLGKKMSELVPASGEKAYTLTALEDTSDAAGEAFRELVAAEGQDAQDILELARSFEGVIKGESIHACGFVISPEPLDDLVPLRYASHSVDADPAAPRVICWDGPEVEDYGFLKMDILGLMNLDIVSSTLANIEMTTGEVVTMDSIPHADTQGDPKVQAAYDLIAAGRTAGVFQMESPGMIKIAQDVVPASLTDLSAIVALFRPGPLAAKVPDRYAARKNGLEDVDYNQFTANPMEQEWIAKVLGDTYGVFVFQESLMRLGTVIAGFDASQRSVLRKAVGKKDAKKMAEVGKMLAAGAEQEFFDEDGVMISPKFAAKTAAHMFELMKGSASYLFNASHSAAYAHLAYVTAYLKANWPVEYSASILSVVDTNKPEKRLTALQSLRADDITVLAPDVNASRARTAPVNGNVQMGLAEVKDVGAVGHHIVTEREKNGQFKDLHDLMTRVITPGKNGGYDAKLASGAVQGLIEAGALDEFGPRLGLLMTMRAAHKGAITPVEAAWNDVEMSTRQRFRLGVSLGIHPLTSMKDELKTWRTPVRDEYTGESVGRTLSPLHKISDRDGASVLTVGVVSMWEEKGYSGGRRANFTLESSTDAIGGVVWDRTLSALRRQGTVPKVGDVVAVSGRVKVRATVVGDEETGTQDTITTKELNISEIWPINTGAEPVINLPENVFDFGTAYKKLRALAPAPVPPKGGKDKDTTPAPAIEAEPTGATVTVLDEHRKQSRGWVAVSVGLFKNSLVDGRIIGGSEEVKERHKAVGIPIKWTQECKGMILRGLSTEGDRLIVIVKGGALRPEEMLELAQRNEEDPSRWVAQDSGGSTAGLKSKYTWTRMTAEAGSSAMEPELAEAV
ncbi:MAG TPA: DNA polymerase III subunit alpha [Arthrobacter sp.]